MAFNGAGTFNRLYNWVTDRGGGVKILAERMDNEMDGMATGLSTCIAKDGQTTITGNIPFNNKRITGLGDATAATDALNRQSGDARYGLAASTFGTDNLVLRSDGTSRGIQGSSAALTDAGALSGLLSVALGDGTTSVSVAAGNLGGATGQVGYLTTTTAHALALMCNVTEVARCHTNNFFGIGEPSPVRKLHVTVDDASNTSVTQLARLNHTTSGVPGNGIGAGLEFAAETSASNIEIGMSLDAVFTDTTAASEDCAFSLKLMTAGATAAERMAVSSLGAMTLTDGTVTVAVNPNSTVGVFGTTSNHPVQFYANNTLAVNITTGGQVGTIQGSSSTPALAFTGDVDTGIWQGSVNQWGVTVGGTSMIYAVNSGTTFNIGFGSFSNSDTPSAPAHIRTEGSANVSAIFDKYNSTGNNEFRFRRAYGSKATPTQVTAGGEVGSMTFHGIDNGGTPAFRQGASIACFATTDITSTSAQMYLRFANVPSGSLSQSETMRISTDGVSIGALSANSTSATGPFLYITTSAGAPTGVPVGATGKVALHYDTTNNKIYVYNGAWKASAALT